MQQEFDLIRLVYVSEAIDDLSNRDLNAIISTSIKNNLRFDITGILVFGSGKFMQFLEGPEFNVTKIFSLIKKDYRHYGVYIIRREKVCKRQFNDWQMRLTHPNEICENSGVIYNKLFQHIDMSEEEINHATESRSWLLAFKHAN